MLLLLAEIVLTVFAWRNGWKWLALIPVGAALGLGFIIGLMIGAGMLDVDVTSLWWVDIFAVIALIWMLFKKGNQGMPGETK
jgi:hypothetical protein